MKFNAKGITLFSILGFCSSAFATNATVDIDIRYKDALSGKRKNISTQTKITTTPSARSTKGIDKAIVVAQMANLFETTLKRTDKLCKKITPHPCVRPPVQPRRPVNSTSVVRAPVRCLPVDRDPRRPIIIGQDKKCKEQATKLAKAFSKDLKKLNFKILALTSDDENLIKFISVGQKLAKNIKEAKFNTPIRRPMRRSAPTAGGMRTASRPAAGNLNVTTGGAKSVDHFIQTIDNGRVPKSSSFSIEGFISHFDFPFTGKQCKELLCIQPIHKVENNKLFIQLGMGTRITEATFKRKKLNLSVVLDISGSMSATDGTEISRIDWAKKALLKTVKKMNKDDLLSIVLFNLDSEILLKPTPVSKIGNAAKIKKLIKDIEAGGSTNLEKGLRDGLNLVSEQFIDGYENRVILISDAGLNTGTTAQADLLKLVSDFATEDIGLTAIGMGLNFKQDLIHAITMGKGSNYLFVNSGKGLKAYFDQFDFLVSPIAYNLKAKLQINGLDTKLVKAYGVPMKPGAQVQEILDIRTLFLASEGGGTILLEYKIQ